MKEWRLITMSDTAKGAILERINTWYTVPNSQDVSTLQNLIKQNIIILFCIYN